jgi:hypothetical protein
VSADTTQSQGSHVQMQGGFIPQHNFKERHTSNPRLSRCSANT